MRASKKSGSRVGTGRDSVGGGRSGNLILNLAIRPLSDISPTTMECAVRMCVRYGLQYSCQAYSITQLDRRGLPSIAHTGVTCRGL